MKVISFLNNKGGVGKTSSAAAIAHMIAEVHHKKVLIIDIDPQGNISSLYSETKVFNLLTSLLKNTPQEEKETSVEDLFLDSTIDIHDCIKKTKYENLDIIPALLTLSQCEDMLKADIRTPQQFRLKSHLAKIQDEYDFCVIDCSPSVNILNVNGIVASNQIYIPLKCDAWSATGMCIARKLVKDIQSYNSGVQIAGCFFTQWEGNKNVAKTTHELLTAFIPELLLPYTICKSKLIEELSFTQQPLLAYDEKMTSKVTKDYLALTEFIVNN